MNNNATTSNFPRINGPTAKTFIEEEKEHLTISDIQRLSYQSFLLNFITILFLIEQHFYYYYSWMPSMFLPS